MILLTRFSEHPGYPFSRREIALKVRFVVATNLGLPLDQVREEHRFVHDYYLD